MKKTVVLFFFIISSLTFAQISTVPALPTANDEITMFEYPMISAEMWDDFPVFNKE